MHRVFGIRHHGPGCARALNEALESLVPDCVLIEGPPDAEGALALLADPELRPPVALLIHDVEDPQRAVFYPFVVFSPEWQALRYASQRGVPVHFIDLPAANSLARGHRRRDAKAVAAPAQDPPLTQASETHPLTADEQQGAEGEEHADEDEDEDGGGPEAALRDDPVGALAQAAGFSDHEQWWDVQIEQRREAAGLFEAIAEAMTALRRRPSGAAARKRTREQLREAHMRIAIRKAAKEGHERIAVVCGAWHVPALVELGSAQHEKQDRALLKGLPKVKVSSAWIPWTYSRLSFRSGYGAGVDSPGWYAHLWEHGQRAAAVWVVRAARLLRSEDLDASSASVIETVRLAEALAVVRGLSTPGLTELREAILAALCGGDAVRLMVIRERLEIGEEIGAVPEGAAQVPLQRDFEKEAKRLRLKLTTEPILLELDLRKDKDREKSWLLHRLGMIGLAWGEALGSGTNTGTFREIWRLAWHPELAVDLVAANLYGNTVATAAREKLRERARKANVAELAAMLELALAAQLPELMPHLLVELDARAAQSGDVELLLSAAEPLARVMRYGNVRGAQASTIEPVFKALLERALVGMVPACTQLDDDAASRLLDAMQRTHTACLLLEQPSFKQEWLTALEVVIDDEAVHAKIRGRACRLLLEQNRLSPAELERRAHLALGPAVAATDATRWLEGLIAGNGLFLVHHETLMRALDAWLASLAPEVFQAELPLLRRAFASFASAERRALGRKLKGVGEAGPPERSAAPLDFDADRARRVLPVLAAILGVEHG